jgi:hypothetical protein
LYCCGAELADLKAQCAALVQTIEKLAGDNEDMATRLNTATAVQEAPAPSTSPVKGQQSDQLQSAVVGSGTIVSLNGRRLLPPASSLNPEHVGSMAANPAEDRRRGLVKTKSKSSLNPEKGLQRGPAVAALTEPHRVLEVVKGPVPQGGLRAMGVLPKTASTLGAGPLRVPNLAWLSSSPYGKMLEGNAERLNKAAGRCKTVTGTSVGSNTSKKGSSKSGPSWWGFLTGIDRMA